MSSVSKAFCSFCKALGKPEAVYTSHYVKDKIDGVVVCPALLANECGYCHDHGHTPKHCPKLAARDARRTARPRVPNRSRAAQDDRVRAHQARLRRDRERALGRGGRSGWRTARGGSKARSADGSRPTPIRVNPFEALAVQKPVAGRPTAPSGPRPVAVKSPQGVWNAAHKAEVAGLKAELEAMKQKLAQQATADPPSPPPLQATAPDAEATDDESAVVESFAPIPLPDDGDFLADLGKKAPSGDGWGSDSE